MNLIQNWCSKPVVNSVAPEEEAVLALFVYVNIFFVINIGKMLLNCD
jgi:hypothetical protein